MAILEAINTGTARPGSYGVLKRTAIDKRPVEGTVYIGPLGVAGDEVADLKHHGGPDQAVYAFAREDYTHWEAELGRPLAAGAFGENLTTVGLDVQGARIGERWQVGGLPVGGLRRPHPVRDVRRVPRRARLGAPLHGQRRSRRLPPGHRARHRARR